MQTLKLFSSKKTFCSNKEKPIYPKPNIPVQLVNVILAIIYLLTAYFYFFTITIINIYRKAIVSYTKGHLKAFCAFDCIHIDICAI